MTVNSRASVRRSNAPSTEIKMTTHRLELFKLVKEKCERLATPAMESVWRPIMEQVDYLIAFECGEPIDRTLIKNIDIGLRALRNLDDIYPEITKELFEVQRNADAMAIENGMKNVLAP